MAGARRLRISLLTATAVSLLGGPAADAAVSRDFFGVNAVRPTDADYAGMSSFGIGTLRVEVGWRTVQAVEGGDFQWPKIDVRYRAAAEAGLRPLPVVLGTPTWINADGKPVPPVRSDAHRGEWQRFIATFYLRYGPGGVFWRNNPDLDGSLALGELILWNEQNARAFWHSRANPSEYAALLRITREALKPRFGSAEIVIGGMYGYPDHPSSMKMTTFLRRLYRKPGTKLAAAGVALHPYAGGLSGVKRQIKKARRVMREAGEGGEGIWVSEIGWASAGNPSGVGSFLVKSEERQAQLLKKTFRMLIKKRERWRIRRALWFTWRDFGGEEVCTWCPHAGLHRRNSDPKPSAEAYRALIDAGT